VASGAEMSELYMVVNEENLLALVSVSVFGKDVPLFCIFQEEEQALEFMWSAELQTGSKYSIRRITGDYLMTPVD
jgi:hypothetical protein